ncbi:MAG: HAMP domain-containing histidine kinase [Chloroflexi bacterium]|nr:HAMP domain-containing histidine kinase [Chloroflexota bacterium]
MSPSEATSDAQLQARIEALERKITMLDRDAAALNGQMEQISRDRIEYLQNVSHQLVAPLNAMKWHIENLTEGRIKDIERIRKVLRSVYSQATLAVHLAKNFALMSNLEADHSLSALKEPLQPVDLYRLMVNLADDFQPLAWDKNIQIKVIDQPLKSAPEVLAIKPLLSQVFSNILENAVKYSSQGTQIVIDGSHDTGARTVSVRVKNSGIPLSHEDEQHVFERGYRSKDARNLYPAGTGFGLYIAKAIVDIHEGTILASSDESGKSVFTVTLHVDKLMGKARQRGQKDSTAH